MVVEEQTTPVIVEYITPRIWIGLSFSGGQQWFACKIDNETYQSRSRARVEEWRDDKITNAKYYRELAELRHRSTAEYYASKTRDDNYTGD